MAKTRTPTRQRTPSRTSRGKPWMTERQLEAYLQTKETLRRLRAAASLPSDVGHGASPSQTG